MIAIDSSPLIHLSKIGKLDILKGYSIVTTPSVREEVINKNCTLLTSGKALVLLARSWGIKVWWVTTLILNQVKTGKLSKEEGKAILDELVQSGMKIETKVYIRMIRER